MRHLLTLLVGATFFGQVITAAEAPDKSPRTCRILFLAPQENAPDKAFLHDGKISQEVNLPRMNLSDVYEIANGDVTLRLLQQPPVADQPLPSDAPAVTLPESIKDCYIIVATDPNNKLIPLRMQVIDANPSGFKPGQMMWLNLSPHAVGGVLGDEKLNLKAKSQAIVDAPAKGFETYPVTLGYQPEEGKRAEPLCSTFWRHNPEARSVLFVLMAPNSRIPSIRSFSDSRAAESEKEIAQGKAP